MRVGVRRKTSVGNAEIPNKLVCKIRLSDLRMDSLENVITYTEIKAKSYN